MNNKPYLFILIALSQVLFSRGSGKDIEKEFIQNLIQSHFQQLEAKLNLEKPIFKSLKFDRSASRDSKQMVFSVKTKRETLYIYLTEKIKKSLLNQDESSISYLNKAYGKIYDENYKISKNRGWQEIAWWKGEGFFRSKVNTKKVANHSQRARSSSIEYKSPQETFATNFDLFMTDEDFQCRRPLMQRYLKNLYKGFTPFLEKSCDSFVNAILMLADPTKNIDFSLLKLKPEKVYAVDYIWGSPGNSIAGAYGHGMYRLVVCPEEVEVGPECRDYEHYHVMINFAANLDTIALNPWKGLVGKYPSLLFAESFRSTRDRYIKRQRQDLYAIPLKLSPENIKDFIERIIQLHWTYEGKYKFLSNNCATEALNLLKATLPHNKKLAKAHVLRPRRLIDITAKLGLSDPSVIEDLAKAKTEGFYYESYDNQYREGFKRIQEAALKLETHSQYEKMNIDQYIQETSPSERRELFNQLNESGLLEDRLLANGFWMLERHIETQMIFNGWGDVVLSASDDIVGDQFGEDLKSLIRTVSGLQAPSTYVMKDAGYGIPRWDFIKTEYSDEQDANEDEKVDRSAITAFRKAYESDLNDKVEIFQDELATTEENIKVFKKKMLSLF